MMGRGSKSTQEIAYHEAGHAVIRLSRGLKVEYATIKSRRSLDGRVLGHVVSRKGHPRKINPGEVPSRAQMKRICGELQEAYAGLAAEAIFKHGLPAKGQPYQLHPRSINRLFRGTTSDMKDADRILSCLKLSEVEQARVQQAALRSVLDTLVKPEVWAQVQAIAKRLLRHEYLDGKHLENLCHNARLIGLYGMRGVLKLRRSPNRRRP